MKERITLRIEAPPDAPTLVSCNLNVGQIYTIDEDGIVYNEWDTQLFKMTEYNRFDKPSAEE